MMVNDVLFFCILVITVIQHVVRSLCLQGFYELIPQDLIKIFDENELEVGVPPQHHLLHSGPPTSIQ